MKTRQERKRYHRCACGHKFITIQTYEAFARIRKFQKTLGQDTLSVEVKVRQK